MKKLTPRQAQIRFQSIASVIQECQARALVLASETPQSKVQESQRRRAVTLNQKRLNEALTRMVLFCTALHTNPVRLAAAMDQYQTTLSQSEEHS